MTGAYLRVERDGEWRPVEVEFLTDAELREAFEGRSSEELVRWMAMLCSAIRRHFTEVRAP